MAGKQDPCACGGDTPAAAPQPTPPPPPPPTTDKSGSGPPGFCLEELKKLREGFYCDPKNILAQNVCTRVDPLEACLSRRLLEETQHVFSHKVESEGKPVTSQKNSGRCWIFATMNVMRLPFMKQHNIDEFEFSQGYLFFWDKDPTCDGGQWDMIVNLINKYGVIPKKYFPECYSMEASMRMNAVLKSKLREYCKDLRTLMDGSCSDEDLTAKIHEQMGEVYRIVGICLGIPPETFTWEYYDKTKQYNNVGPLTPLDFYLKHVKPAFNVDDKVCLVTDPRPTNSFGKAYTVDCLNNMVGGRKIVYNNQPPELLMKLVADSIKGGEAVWFGCEVSKRFAAKQGIEDLRIHDYKLVFGVDVTLGMTKADRLIYGESMMTHAMAFTAVTIGEDGYPVKFRVENSWGDDRGDKGYLIMTSDWFKEFVFEVVLDRKYVPKDVLDVYEQEPIVLPAWDPMGTLAP